MGTRSTLEKFVLRIHAHIRKFDGGLVYSLGKGKGPLHTPEGVCPVFQDLSLSPKEDYTNCLFWQVIRKGLS